MIHDHSTERFADATIKGVTDADGEPAQLDVWYSPGDDREHVIIEGYDGEAKGTGRTYLMLCLTPAAIAELREALDFAEGAYKAVHGLK